MTDARKPLMIVPKIRDIGHRATFWSTGGDIVENGAGKVTKFDRVDDAYWLEVDLPNHDAYGQEHENVEGFSRRDM